jgi:FkbM family methyltransferase
MELLLVDELVYGGEVAVDVGANFGLFARRLARLVGRAGHVHLFEPHPGHHEQLSRFGKSPRVTYLPLALSDHTGTAELQVPRFAGASVESMATLEEDAPPGDGFDAAGDRIRVQVERFDRALERESRPIGFVKCDVEGHELAFLRGGRRRLTHDHPTLLLEIEQRHQRRDVNETFALLDEFGYEGWIVRPDGLAPHATFDVERDQLAILRALPPGGDPGPNYLNTFLFVSRRRPLPVQLPQARGAVPH